MPESVSLGGKAFEYVVRVGYADTDRMGFVHHSRYLVYMESARTELLRATGDSYRAMEERGFLLPLLDAHVRYIRPAVYDDVLHIRTVLSELSRVRLKFDYTILCPDRDVEIVKSYTSHAFMNKEGRPVRAGLEEYARLQTMLGGEETV